MKSKSFVTTLLGIFLSLSIASCSNECIEIYVDCLSNAQSVEDALKISKDFQEMFAESFIDPDFEAIFSVGGGSSALWGITME